MFFPWKLGSALVLRGDVKMWCIEGEKKITGKGRPSVFNLHETTAGRS